MAPLFGWCSTGFQYSSSFGGLSARNFFMACLASISALISATVGTSFGVRRTIGPIPKLPVLSMLKTGLPHECICAAQTNGPVNPLSTR